MRLAEVFLFFHNKLNEFKSTGARIVDCIYHTAVEVFCTCVFWYENV